MSEAAVFAVRPAAGGEIARLAEIMRLALAGLGFVPDLHTPGEDRAFLAGALLGADVYVVEQDGAISGFVVAAKGRIHALYVAPDRQGRGIGSALLNAAIEAYPGPIDLWCFAANTGARRFYERHGFVVIEETDGNGNEEGLPDMRYRRVP